jgi:O-antigen/teichoic acid export membrane protein
MQKQFLPNLVFILSINLIVKPLYVFGVEVSVQNSIGAQSYGLFFALLNSAYLLQIINDFGIQIFNNRQISKDNSLLPDLIPGLSYLKIGLSTAYLALLLVLGLFLGYQDVLLLLMLIGFNLVLVSFILFVRSSISGLGNYRTDSILSALDKVLMIFVIGGLLLFLPAGSFTIYHFILGQTASFAFTLLVAIVLLKRHGSLAYQRIPVRQLKRLARQALPYALVVFLMTLYTRSDGVMIKALLTDGDFEAGVYAAGYRILDALNMIAFLFAVMLLPMFSKALNDPSLLQQLISEGIRYMAVLVIPVCLFSVLHAGLIMDFLYVQADVYWGLVFQRLIITFFATGIMYIFGTLLTAAGQLRTLNIVYATTVALNIILNFILIPEYKAGGAALATLITQLFAAACILFLCFKTTAFRISTRTGLQITGFSGVCFVTFWLAATWWPASLWHWSVPALALGTVGSAYLFRLIRWSELRGIGKEG